MWYRIIVFFLFPSILYAQSTVESIPNQKLINGSYVSNPDQLLSPVTVASIDSLLASLESKTTAQVAVVAVRSIGDVDIFEFAQSLFTSWGIGTKSNDNGLLLLLVYDKRTIRFHTGYGLEGILPDAVCLRIQREYMVPAFKLGDYDAGMLAGLEQVAKIVSDPTYAEEVKTQEQENEVSDYTAVVMFLSIFCLPFVVIIYFVKAGFRRFSNSKNPEHTEYPEMRQNRWIWLLLYAGIPALIVTYFGTLDDEKASGYCLLALYGYFLLLLFNKLWRMKKVIQRLQKTDDYYSIVQFIRSSQVYWFFMALIFPFPFFFYFFYHLARKRIYRNHSRPCVVCQGNMIKLNEKDDDLYLTKAKQKEEELRSIDYDVWKCEKCEAIQDWNYPNKSSKYSECPSCKTVAYHFVSSRTIVSATYSSSGRGEQVHGCKFCGKTKKSSYNISRLTRSTSSGSSSSFGSSSSSSSGGSWGGGSSGGGGASSSW
jgi:uncharacterized protein